MLKDNYSKGSTKTQSEHLAILTSYEAAHPIDVSENGPLVGIKVEKLPFLDEKTNMSVDRTCLISLQFSSTDNIGRGIYGILIF